MNGNTVAKKINRLSKHPAQVVAVRADDDFYHLLTSLTKLKVEGDAKFWTTSEVIYQAMYEMANRLGLKTPLGGRYETLFDTAATPPEPDVPIHT